MASRKTYTCFLCQKAGHDVQVFLDGKDEAGHAKYLNEDMTRHTHLGNCQQQQQPQSAQVLQQEQVSSAAASLPLLRVIDTKLDRIITILEKQQQQWRQIDHP